jgi:hypothetical protein
VPDVAKVLTGFPEVPVDWIEVLNELLEPLTVIPDVMLLDRWKIGEMRPMINPIPAPISTTPTIHVIIGLIRLYWSKNLQSP